MKIEKEQKKKKSSVQDEQAWKKKKRIRRESEDMSAVHYWIYAPGNNSCKWEEFYRDGIIAIGWGEIGDLHIFSSKNEIKTKMKECYGEEYSYVNKAHAVWQFANEMQPGDIVFVKKGTDQIIGRGVILSEYEYDPERLDSYKHIRKIIWTNYGHWPHPGKAAVKTLTDITAYTAYVEKLNNLFEEELKEDKEEKEIIYSAYPEEKFFEEVYLSQENYYTLKHLLEHKKNVILEGAPGVGKTFAAKRLAYSLMGTKDTSRVMMIQFHQSYAYEDFIMGFRPAEKGGFELKKGVFYRFCKKAEVDSDNAYFFIIDEINRGNLSKIFGELFMLIEKDKRGLKLQLPYSDEKFSVPPNVYLIGMMNTADRSLAMLDYALRRRFAFFKLVPAFDTEGFKQYCAGKKNPKLNRLIDAVKQLNQMIKQDETLGEGFCIGHSFFCTEHKVDDRWLNEVVQYELLPLLNEYWFDEPEKVSDWTHRLNEVIQ